MRTLVVCAVLVGCGGGDRGTTAVEDLGTELGIASCGRQFACCTDAEIMAQYMGITFDGEPITTEEQCVAFAGGLFTALAIPQYKRSLEQGRITYDGEAAAACIAAIERVSCEQYSTGDVDGLSGCRPFILPEVADGGACAHDYECTSSNCVGATSSTEGPDTDGACEPIPTRGEACEGTCAPGLYCGYDLAASMEVCQPIKADGIECSLDEECTSEHCDDATNTCATPAPTCDGR